MPMRAPGAPSTKKVALDNSRNSKEVSVAGVKQMQGKWWEVERRGGQEPEHLRAGAHGEVFGFYSSVIGNKRKDPWFGDKIVGRQEGKNQDS